MPSVHEVELSPQDIDSEREASTIDTLVEQGALAPLDDDPFRPELAERLTEDERAKLALAHDFRDARKLNYVINRGDLTTVEVSEADPEQIQDLVHKEFDAKYQLPIMRPDQPEVITERKEGHFAEDALVKIFNESGLQVHAEHSSDYLDATGKADIILFIRVGKEKEVVLKIQAKSAAKATDIEKLPSNALLVELQSISLPQPDRSGRRTYSNEKVIELAERGNLGDKRNFTSKYFSRLLEALKNSPRNVYPEAKSALKLA